MGVTLRKALALLVFSAGAPTIAAQDFPAVNYGVVADSTVNNAPALQAAFDAAHAGRVQGQIAWVTLPPGVIGYQGIVRIVPDSLGVRGCGGTVLTRDVTRPGSPTGGGQVYYPVRRADHVTPGACVSRLKVLDGAMRRTSRRGRQPITRISLIPAPRVTNEKRLNQFWLEDLVLDGNLSGNLKHILAIPEGRRKPVLQDSPSYTGLNVSRHDNVDLCAEPPQWRQRRDGRRRLAMGSEVGTLITVRRVEVGGYAATGFLGDYCTRWDLDTVRFGSSVYNHSAYKVDGGGVRNADGSLSSQTPGGRYGAWGGWTDVTLTGTAWSDVVAMRGLYIKRLVYEDYVPNPMRRTRYALVGVRHHSAYIDGVSVQERYPVELFGVQPGASGYVDADGGGVPPASKVVLPRGAAR